MNAVPSREQLKELATLIYEEQEKLMNINLKLSAI